MGDTRSKESRRMKHEDWLKEAVVRFGQNPRNWKFKCPSCGNVQSIADFEKLDLGDTKPEEVVYFSCIGRWAGGMENEMGSGKSPCNYTSGGLLRISPLTVIAPDGSETNIFEFADPEETQVPG